jgi:hypothetical protein
MQIQRAGRITVAVLLCGGESLDVGFTSGLRQLRTIFADDCQVRHTAASANQQQKAFVSLFPADRRGVS